MVPESPAKRQAYEEQAIQTFYLSHADPTEMLALLNLAGNDKLSVKERDLALKHAREIIKSER